MPPSVFEINIEDLINPFIVKVYKIDNENGHFIGLSLMAINFNYVVHSMLDAETQQEVLRLYCRNSTQKSLAYMQITLPHDSKSSFYIFPNMYVDTLWLRDEKRINIT